MASEGEQAKSQSSTRYWPFTMAAWTAGFAGFSMIVGGAGHLIAVIAAALDQHKPFDFHQISLIATGGILLYPGLLNLALAKRIKHGKPWAFAMSAFATAALLAYLVLLLFQTIPPKNTDPFAGAGSSARYSILINGTHLVVLLAVWIGVVKRKPG